jgi:probable F420-dependent oxidoreductase
VQIGSVVRLGPVADGASPSSYSAIRDMARRMDAAGFDSMWVYDHLLYRWRGRPTAGIWECWTVLSALAEATQRIQIGTLVACTQFRNPALLAKMAATLDEVSGGRLTLGLGAGWHQPEFDAFGFPFDHRASRFEEALEVIAPLLRHGQVDFAGAYYSARECELIPRPPRQNGPPLLIAGSGPRMLRLVARYADSFNTGWPTTPAAAMPALEGLRVACEAEGRDPATLSVTVSVPIGFPELGTLDSRREYLTGEPTALAESLAGFSDLGAQHVMVEFSPYTPAALDKFAEVVAAFRQT